MAGVLGIYGLIIVMIISTVINTKAKSYYLFDGYAHLSSGIACGLAGLFLLVWLSESLLMLVLGILLFLLIFCIVFNHCAIAEMT